MQTRVSQRREADQTALLSAMFSWVQNPPSSQAHTLLPVCHLPLLEEQNLTTGPGPCPSLVSLPAGSRVCDDRSRKLLGPSFTPAQPDHLAAALVRFAGAEQSQNPPQHQEESHARQSWCPGQAGGRSKHRTQAGQGAAHTDPVTAPVADSPTESGLRTEPQFSHLWHGSDL